MKIHSEKRTMESMKKSQPLYCVSRGTAVVGLEPPLTAVRITMDFFQHRYYRLSKIFLTLIGQWPYHSTNCRRGFLGVFTFLVITGSAPPILAAVKYRGDWSMALDSVIPCILLANGIMKFLCIMWNSQKILKLLNRICTDWKVWSQDREINILHEYADLGEKMMIVFTAANYSTGMVFTTEPIISKIIDAALKNGTEVGKFPYPVEFYYFDPHKYYTYITMHCYICACVVVIPIVACDSMLIMCVQHICGVFAALGYKVEQIGNNGTLIEKGEIPFELNKRNLVDLASFIGRHNDAIEYANLIDATYTWIFFFNTGIGLIMINMLGLQILRRTDDPESTIRFVAMVLALEFIFFTECYISQILADHSTNISYYIHKSQWYRLSPKIQKLLLFITMRCRTPCQLTAGRMLIISLRTFAVTFRTAMSYFAVFRIMDDGFNDAT